MKNNGKALAVEDLLRADLVQTRQALAHAVAGHRNSAAQAGQLNAIVATLLHLRGDAMVELSNEATQAAHEVSWHRVKLEVLEHEDGVPNSLRVSLVPVTTIERAELARAEKKAAKKAAKKGPKILGADGQELPDVD